MESKIESGIKCEIESRMEIGKVGILQLSPYGYREQVVTWTTQLKTTLTHAYPQFIPTYTTTLISYLIDGPNSNSS